MHAKSPRKKNTPGSRHVLYAQNSDAPPESRSKIGKLRFDHGYHAGLPGAKI